MHHPAWHLLRADHAAFVAAFLDAAFREPNHRSLPESQLGVMLEDHLYSVHSTEGDDAFPRDAAQYLNEWAQHGWLRKFYPPDTDEAHYDITPATERALQWIDTLFTREFVGTESRLFTALHLLRQIVYGVEGDVDVRIARLEAEKEALDRQIEVLRNGTVPMLDERTIREHFQHFGRVARELLSDFRAVEHNVRALDRSVRERIAGWTEEKASLLQAVFGEHDEIADSDEGRSFRAFWDFLMSPESRDELTTLLDRVYEIDSLGDLRDDARLRRIHYDWMTAGERTQRTVARLSQQLRRFIDDQSYLEDKRIVQILDRIGRHGLDLRDAPPTGTAMWINGIKADIALPMERPLYLPSEEAELHTVLDDEEIDVDLSVLYDQVAVDPARLLDQIRFELRDVDQVSLGTVIERHPLREGLAELVAYVSLATGDHLGVIDEEQRDVVRWTDRHGVRRRGRIPRIVFQRSTRHE